MRSISVGYGNKGMECDVVLANDTELVVIEVKTACYVEDVKEFAQKLPISNDFLSSLVPTMFTVPLLLCSLMAGPISLPIAKVCLCCGVLGMDYLK